MKNILLFVFLLSPLSVFAQSNEVILSNQILNDNFIKGSSLSYYRTVTPGRAIGIKTHFTWDKFITYYNFTSKNYAATIDLVHRQDFLPKSKIRLLGELGLSFKKQIQNEIPPIDPLFLICMGCHGDEFYPQNENELWSKTNHIGLTASLGIDVQFKVFSLGLSYGLKRYFIHDVKVGDNIENVPNLNINLGYKF